MRPSFTLPWGSPSPGAPVAVLRLPGWLSNGYGRNTARRGPATKPASSRSGMISVSPTGSPSKRSTARRFTPPHAHAPRGRRQRLSQPALLRLAQRDERAAAALDEERRLAAEQDDVRPGHPGCSGSGPLRPRQRGAVGLGRVGGREHERLRLLAVLRPQLAQALDRAAERELRAAEAFDEVAAPAEAERLQRAQLAVDRAVAAGDPLGADAVACDDPVPLQQQLGEGAVGPRPGSAPAGPEETAGRATSGPASPSSPRRGGARSGARAAARPAPGSGGRHEAASTRRS